MPDQPEFHAVDGQLHRVTYEPVDEGEAEVETQSQVDQAQNQFNAAMQLREQAEQVYLEAENAAELASNQLDATKLAEEEAEGALQKSLAKRDSLARAKQLAVSQLESEDAESVDDGIDEDETTDSEAVNLTVKVAA